MLNIDTYPVCKTTRHLITSTKHRPKILLVNPTLRSIRYRPSYKPKRYSSTFSTGHTDQLSIIFHFFCRKNSLRASVRSDWAIYWTLRKILRPLATINLPKSATFLGNFCKGVKIYNFSSEIILGNFYRHLAIFSGHTDEPQHFWYDLHSETHPHINECFGRLVYFYGSRKWPKVFLLFQFAHFKSLYNSCGQSYKHLMIIIYDSTVVPYRKIIAFGTIVELYFTIVKRL